MNSVNWKKILLVLVPMLVVLGVGYVVLKKANNQQNSAISNGDASVALPSMQDSKPDQVENVQNSTSSRDENIANEVMGKISAVYETEDPNVVLIEINAEIVPKANLETDEENSKDEVSEQKDEKVSVVNKKFTIAVDKNVPIQNGTFDDLSEDDFVKVSIKEDIYSNATEFTATNLEEL